MIFEPIITKDAVTASSWWTAICRWWMDMRRRIRLDMCSIFRMRCSHWLWLWRRTLGRNRLMQRWIAEWTRCCRSRCRLKSWSIWQISLVLRNQQLTRGMTNQRSTYPHRPLSWGQQQLSGDLREALMSVRYLELVEEQALGNAKMDNKIMGWGNRRWDLLLAPTTPPTQPTGDIEPAIGNYN